ncbi:uncharacterized protein VTP21DRAFT_10095 [Calcarisporiella thermophila]|uniref:uncharacterized protein n=1 Tax=Calcarisporiella thermophila TaxID=911321 RepID=UPI0037426225
MSQSQKLWSRKACDAIQAPRPPFPSEPTEHSHASQQHVLVRLWLPLDLFTLGRIDSALTWTPARFNRQGLIRGTMGCPDYDPMQ